ncbi:NADH-quinone oxidoreductase subunit 5 family protein [Saccharicrinis sp. GN24d3]|uniref:NADH-quinone oxidoreductase subunit 5 family protein n=1 Tax=Saccharicrinis sp. GN24d3 TaxID=3458416 RepID=UPI0040368080
MSEAGNIIILPIVVGILLLIFPDKVKIIKGLIAVVISLISGFFAIKLYQTEAAIVDLSLFSGLITEDSLSLRGINTYCQLNIDPLSQLITLGISFFAVLISIYSLTNITREKKVYHFYPFFLITLGCANGAALADNLILFLVFWGALGLTLYKLIKGYDEESSAAAKETLILIGASDSVMMIGIALIGVIAGTYNMSELNISTSTGIGIMAFLTLLVGSFTKAGAFPFHTWVPDYTQKAPAASSAFLPASLDKLLGIYLLARLCTDIFVLNQWLKLVILILGVTTIITAVLMALVQHDYKRLLGFHAVSQVGYMVIGFGLGTPIGVAAGLFHMVNHALYKSGLFLSAGSVYHQTGQSDLNGLGGLSKSMPITFIAALVFALSISGIPPLNGFASKWMIYQGIIDFGTLPGIANQLWMVWLALAVIGSALTLASFVKFMTGIFMGRRNPDLESVKEVNVLMLSPKIILALICILLGVFATDYFVPKIFYPITGQFKFVGIWQSSFVSLLVVLSVILGLLIYLIGNIKNFRTADSYVGGEKWEEKAAFPVTGFYDTIRNAKVFKSMYDKAEKHWFDIYDLTKSVVLSSNKVLSKAHTGILTDYTIWLFAGLVIMLVLFLIV